MARTRTRRVGNMTPRGPVVRNAGSPFAKGGKKSTARRYSCGGRMKKK